MRDTAGIDVREAYKDYLPAVNAARIVSQLLCIVPEKYLRGLDCVVLTNEASLSRKDRIGRVWSRRRKYDKSRIRGRYHFATRSSAAYIELRVDKILLSLPVFRDIVFGHVLYHEIGHHIHETIRPEHREKEDVANNWAGKINARFIRHKYWYFLPFLVPASKIYIWMKRRRWIAAR